MTIQTLVVEGVPKGFGTIRTNIPPWRLVMKCPDCGRALELKRISRRGDEYEFVPVCKGPHDTRKPGPRESDTFTTGPGAGTRPGPKATPPPQIHDGRRTSGEAPADPRVRRGE
jgi:hypothetical protein